MGFIADIIRKSREGRLGFSIDEAMTGKHEFTPQFGPEGRFPFEFKVNWGPENLKNWLTPGQAEFMVAELAGTVTVGGLCLETPCQGQLEMRYLKDATIRYNFEFEVDGSTYQYQGEKVNIKPWNLPVSHTTCYGTIEEKETGKLVSRSVTHFKLHTLPGFLISLRLK